ncbi:unnamed protein product [Rhizopus stolonifer]
MNKEEPVLSIESKQQDPELEKADDETSLETFTTGRETTGYIDFVVLFPYDINIIIFSYLALDTRVKAMGVSKIWRHFLLSWSGIWRDLDFRYRNVDVQIVKRYINYAQKKNVRHLALFNMPKNQMCNIMGFVIDESCQNLETLELESCELMFVSLTRLFQFVGENLVYINLNECQGNLYTGLDELEFGELGFDETEFDRLVIDELVFDEEPEFDESSFGGPDFDDEPDFDGLPFDNTPFDIAMTSGEAYKTKIKVLTIGTIVLNMSTNTADRMFQHFSQLRTLDFGIPLLDTDIFYRALNSHCPNLDSLTLNIARAIGKRPPHGAIGLSIQHSCASTMEQTSAWHLLPFFSSDRLKTLTLRNITDTGPSLGSVVILLGTLSHLRKLHLVDTPYLNEKDIISIISSCSQIEDLRITNSERVTDALMGSFSTKNQIKQIDLSGCTQITSLGLKTLLKSQINSLEKAVVIDCDKIDLKRVSSTFQLKKRGVCLVSGDDIMEI